MRKLNVNLDGKFSLSGAIATLVFILLLPLSSHALVQPRGTDTTFDFVTWNVHEFPGTGFRTIDTLAVLINDLDIDMVAFEEISDTTAFWDLVRNHLPDWDGIFAPFDYNYGGLPMRTAVIWRIDRVSVTYIDQLFLNHEYQFPRPPIHVHASAIFGQSQFDFHVIVLHLKAESDPDSEQRRRAAVLMLKAYLDNAVPSAPDQDWIVAGDWNDELEDIQDNNIFWPLLTDSTDYRFLTLPMAGDPYWASYPSMNSLIDHIMITSYANDDYAAGNTITLRLDDEYSNYRYRISDHRPVMAQFAGSATSISDDAAELPREYGVLSVYPNPFNNDARLYFEIKQPSSVNIEIFDLLGRKVSNPLSGYFNPGKYNIQLDASHWDSGVYFARLSSDGKVSSAKLTLLK